MIPHTRFMVALFAFLLCSIGLLFAIDLPLYIAWDSANTSSYTPDQNRKELAWNEFYRISIGIDSLEYRSFMLNMKLQSVPDFIANNLEIRDFRLAFQLTNWEISASSVLAGYGFQYQNHPYHVISANQDDYLYQEMRFNGLEIAHTASFQRYYLQLGGNVHNQATGVLGGNWQSADAAYGAGLQQEFRALDTHWRTPVCISALSLNYKSDVISINTDAALSYFIQHERTEAHTGYYAQADGKFIPTPKAYLYLFANWHTLEPSEELIQQYQLVWHQSLGKLAINPGFALDVFSDSSIYQAFTSLDWLFAPDSRLGAYYRFEDARNNFNKHTVGLQAAMHYGF